MTMRAGRCCGGSGFHSGRADQWRRRLCSPRLTGRPSSRCAPTHGARAAGGRAPCTAGSGCAGSASARWRTAANCRASPSPAGRSGWQSKEQATWAHRAPTDHAEGPRPEGGGNHGEEGHQAMTMTDPVADMLTRLRNANTAYHDTVTMPHSKIKVHIAEILQQEGYIAGWKVEDAEVGRNLVISLKFGPSRERAIAGLKRVSKPGLRVYARKDNLPRVLGGLGVAIISTSSGLMTDKQANKKGVAGKCSPTSGRGSAMSRIGRMPVTVPSGVDVTIDGRSVTVRGPKGTLSMQVTEPIEVSHSDGVITVTRPSDEGEIRALHGLSRSLIANMVTGVTEGYRKTLEIVGVGYRVQARGSDLEFSLGYSHPVPVSPPDGITFHVESPTRFTVEGIDKQQVGEVAANIRKLRKPDPYKGKGVRYQGEQVRRKAGKAGK